MGDTSKAQRAAPTAEANGHAAACRRLAMQKCRQDVAHTTITGLPPSGHAEVPASDARCPELGTARCAAGVQPVLQPPVQPPVHRQPHTVLQSGLVVRGQSDPRFREWLDTRPPTL